MTASSSIESLLPLVRKPSQYIGIETHRAPGEVKKEHLNFCLIFPDMYEIGMSHQGLQILYHILNNKEGVRAHRAYTPDSDMEGLLRESGQALFALESQLPLATYDVLGITLPYELCYTNILTILDLAHIPFRASERDERYPLLIGGGSCAFNPEPVAEFFDAIVLGDGEEIILEIADLLHTAKKNGQKKAETLEQLTALAGVYVPSFFEPKYQDGRLQVIHPLKEGYNRVSRRVLVALDTGKDIQKPLVPITRTVHDRLAIEIARGCTRGCRFCQAGFLYRPVRERSLADIMAIAEEGLRQSGFEEVALLSLSTGDYSCLEDLVLNLMNDCSPKQVSLSMPSMRVGTLSPAIMEQIKRVRKTGFTVAPEAGSERLRQLINKGISEEDLLTTCKDAFSLGWNLIKFYFMVGLPSETEEDVAAIADLVYKAKSQGRGKGRSVQINVGVGTFVPKPHTPFQWEEQLNLEAAWQRINMLKRLIPKGAKLKWHDPKQSFLEGVFARGDRRLSVLIEKAWQKGARLDSWGEHFHLETWTHAAESCGIHLEEYIRKRGVTEVLPWDHLDCRVDKSFLVSEQEKAMARHYTPDCRTQGCQGCGLCDFKTIKPVVQTQTLQASPILPSSPLSGQQTHFSYRVHYRRTGSSRFIGHLELLQCVFRALRRAMIPVAYSQGFNPTPKVGFSPALPVGMESLAEFFDMDLLQPLKPGQELLDQLNNELPQGMTAYHLERAPKKNAQCAQASYAIYLQKHDEISLRSQAKNFLACAHFPIIRERKAKRTEFDIRPLVAHIQVDDSVLLLELIHHQGKPGINPREILETVFACDKEEALGARIVKTKVEEIQSAY